MALQPSKREVLLRRKISTLRKQIEDLEKQLRKYTEQLITLKR